jgi:hypothetical protein
MRLFQGIVPLGIAYKRVPKSNYLTLDSFFLFDKKVNFINIIILLITKNTIYLNHQIRAIF